MTEFECFTVNTKLNQNGAKLDRLKNTKQNIIKNQQKDYIKCKERVNRVSMLNVQISHTSDYIIKLGNNNSCAQYFAKVKAKQAVNIIEHRIKHYQQENGKWKNLQQELAKRINKQQNNIQKQNKQKTGRENSLSQIKQRGTLQVLGKNQEGQQIVNIVEFQEDFQYKNTQVDDKQLQQPAKNTSKVTKNQQTQHNQEAKEPEVTTSQIYQNQKVVQKPKKISKFKSQRMQMKQK